MWLVFNIGCHSQPGLSAYVASLRFWLALITHSLCSHCFSVSATSLSLCLSLALTRVTRYEKTDHFEDLLILQNGHLKSAQRYFYDLYVCYTCNTKIQPFIHVLNEFGHLLRLTDGYIAI